MSGVSFLRRGKVTLFPIIKQINLQISKTLSRRRRRHIRRLSVAPEKQGGEVPCGILARVAWLRGISLATLQRRTSWV